MTTPSSTLQLEYQLLVAEAGIAANEQDFEAGLSLFEQAQALLAQDGTTSAVRGENADQHNLEELARLYFLCGRSERFAETVPRLAGERGDFWRSILAKEPPGSLPVNSKVYDPAYLGLLLKEAGRFDEALKVWREFAIATEVCWELSFVEPGLVALEPSDCCACESEPAVRAWRSRPLCPKCYERFSDFEWFCEKMKGHDPEAIRLIENISGEPFEPFDLKGSVGMYPDIRDHTAPPVLLKLTTLEALVECLDPETSKIWDFSLQCAKENGESHQPRHLWEALENSEHEFPDDPLPQFPENLSFLEVLNQARWFSGLSWVSRSSKIGVHRLRTALQWSGRGGCKRTGLALLSACFKNLPEAQLQEFERLLELHPQSLFYRALLAHSESTRAAECALWMIREHPRHAEGLPRPEHCTGREAASLWCHAVRHYPNDTGVLRNAAGVLTFGKTALFLYRRVAELEPSWHNFDSAATALGDTEQEFAEATRWSERLLSKTREPKQRIAILAGTVHNFFYARMWDRLRELGEELLALAAEIGSEQAHHLGHIALGHTALEEGRRDLARHHLLLAAELEEGEWMMESEGVNLGLTRRFLELGERNIALQYLDRCAEAEPYEEELAGEWAEAIRASDRWPGEEGHF